ncbi:MAG: hypothetical protein RR290_02515 [Clostridia bacterium]
MFKISKIKNKKINYEDISKLYNIISINEEYISIKHQNKIKHLHIYKIEPVVILNSSKANLQNIIQNYSEFLRSINYNFQIFIENEKVNINNYFKGINIEENSHKVAVIDMYKKEFENVLSQNNIYISTYYIAVSLNENDNVSELNNILYNLSKSEIVVEKLKGKEFLEKYIYLKVNMEQEIC